MSESARKSTVPPPAKKIYRKGDEYVCGMCHKRHATVEGAKQCLVQDVKAQQQAKPQPTEERKYRCGHCRNVYSSKEMARDCAARCKDRPTAEPTAPAASAPPAAPAAAPKQKRTERRPKIQVPHWALKKCMKDAEVLVCKRCGAEYSSVRDVIACFDIHPPLPPGQKPQTPDRMKYRTVGDTYQCRYCSGMHAEVADVIVCYDSHEDEREAKQRARDQRRMPKNRANRAGRRPAGDRQVHGRLADAYTLGDRIEGDDDEDYRIESDDYGSDEDDGYSIEGNWKSPTDDPDYEMTSEGRPRMAPRPVVQFGDYQGTMRMDEEGYLLDSEGQPLRRTGETYFDGQGRRLKADAQGYVIDSQGQRYGPDAEGYLIEANWASPVRVETGYTIIPEAYDDVMADADAIIENNERGYSSGREEDEGYTITSTGSFTKSKKELGYSMESTGPLRRVEAPQSHLQGTVSEFESRRKNLGKRFLDADEESVLQAANLEQPDFGAAVVKKKAPLSLPKDVPFSDYSDLRDFGHEQVIAQPDEAKAEPKLEAVRRAERRKYLRVGIKYQCKACGNRFYLKKQVMECFDRHRGDTIPSAK